MGNVAQLTNLVLSSPGVPSPACNKEANKTPNQLLLPNDPSVIQVHEPSEVQLNPADQKCPSRTDSETEVLEVTSISDHGATGYQS